MNKLVRLAKSIRPQPVLFLSYARSDSVLADELAGMLERQDCAVWRDRGELLTGDDFVRRLQQGLVRCNALVFPLTAMAAKSSWCNAEVQSALAPCMPVLVVRRDGEAQPPDALGRLSRDVQSTEWSNSVAAGVRFLSREESPFFLSDDITIIEDSWIAQYRELPGPEILDLAEPEQEILFEGVVFNRVRFEGEFKAEWFRKSTFSDCSFPPELAEALKATQEHRF